MNLPTKKSRSLALDCARITAALFVIMIHTAMHFTNYEIQSVSYFYGNVFDSLSRAGVPLFVMVSGALLLEEEREISIKKVFSKYIWNVLLLYISWSAIYTAIAVGKDIAAGNPIGIGGVIYNFICGNFHMWYLVMILGLYLIVPVLKLLVKQQNSKQIAYIITVSVLLVFLPALLKCLSDFNGMLGFFGEQLSRFEYEFIGVYATYFITGWYVVHVGVKYKKTLYLASIISLLLIILLVQTTGNYSGVYSNGNLIVYLYSLGIFTFINDVCKEKTSSEVVSKLSNLTFGVYIMHIIVLQAVDMLLGNLQITPLSLAIRFVLITTISFVGCLVVSKIPLIKKLVRY